MNKGLHSSVFGSNIINLNPLKGLVSVDYVTVLCVDNILIKNLKIQSKKMYKQIFAIQPPVFVSSSTALFCLQRSKCSPGFLTDSL